MASKSSVPEPKAVPLAEFAADIARRRAAAGVTEIARNSVAPDGVEEGVAQGDRCGGGKEGV